MQGKGAKAMDAHNDALSIARAYHRGWTTKNFDEAISMRERPLKKCWIPVKH
jgi:hypothetical protein